MSTTIKRYIEYTANKCLTEDKFQGYSDEDLVNATLIFSHVLQDVVFGVSKDKLSMDKLLELGEATGNAIRGLIVASTGKDMHQLVANQNKHGK